jgi:hypothetical protein
MKKIRFTVLVVFLMLCSNGIQAQTTQTKLNQIELHKQFLGNWKCELGKDTSCIFEIVPFSAGFELTRKFITKGTIFDMWKELSGYDKKNDKFIGVQLKKSSTTAYLTVTWFTANNICESIPFKDLSDPEKAAVKWTWELKSSDQATMTTTRNAKVVSTVTYTRIKQ